MTTNSRRSMFLTGAILLQAWLMTSALAIPHDKARYLERQNPSSLAQDILPEAEHGNLDALYKLGVMYAHGIGVNKDIHQALRLLNQAADYGSTDAQLMLGLI